jgi:hypothetical protein
LSNAAGHSLEESNPLVDSRGRAFQGQESAALILPFYELDRDALRFDPHSYRLLGLRVVQDSEKPLALRWGSEGTGSA